MTDSLDDMLREYLLREKADPIRDRLKGLADWAMEHDDKDNKRHGELLLAQQSHNFRLATLEQRAEKVEDEVEDTKTHNLESLKKKQERFDNWAFRAVAGVVIFLAGVGLYAAVRDMAAGRPIQTPVHVEK